MAKNLKTPTTLPASIPSRDDLDRIGQAAAEVIEQCEPSDSPFLSLVPPEVTPVTPEAASEKIGQALRELDQTLRVSLPLFRQVRMSLLTQGSVPGHVQEPTRVHLTKLIGLLKEVASLATVELE
jgi:hypothetical protein